MSRKVVIESPVINRRQPLLPDKDEKDHHQRIGEVAGGTAAECAAVWCCCPCALMNLLILAVYKVPTGLCKKAWKKKKRKRLMKKKKALLLHKKTNESGGRPHSHESDDDPEESDGGDEAVDDDGAKKALDLEKEMWDRFYGAGFWRSPSQRDD